MKAVIIAVCLIIVLYFMLIMPRMVNRPKNSPFKEQFFAHRGLHNNEAGVPENSMSAFCKAVEAGFGIELDVQLSKDGIPVIFHDFTLDRMCGKPGKVKDYTYEELQTFSLAGTEEKIPTLEEFLAMVDGKVPLIVELKVEWTNVDVCPAVDRLLARYQGIYCIESFNPLALFWYRRHRNEIMRGQLSTDFRKDGNYRNLIYFLLTYLLTNAFTKPDFIAYNWRFRHKVSLLACRGLYRLPAAAWTVQSAQDLEAAKGRFDVFIFDSFCPDRTKQTAF